MAKLYFRYGVMGSSKSANALMVRYNYEERGQQALMVKPVIDQREGQCIVGSRIGLSHACIWFEDFQNMSVEEIQSYQCIIVDEAQFLSREQVSFLTDVVEHHKIAMNEDGKIYGENNVTGETVELAPKALCSMNMWGFTPDYFDKSEEIFTSFLEKNVNELKAEFYIPYAIDCIIKEGIGKCELLSTPSRWFGVTFKEDRPGVVAKFQEFADKGVYPTPLYKK